MSPMKLQSKFKLFPYKLYPLNVDSFFLAHVTCGKCEWSYTYMLAIEIHCTMYQDIAFYLTSQLTPNIHSLGPR